MRNLKNTEISEFVKEELNKKGFDITFNKILDDIDVSRDEKEEEIELSEEEIIKIKENILNGFLAGLEY